MFGVVLFWVLCLYEILCRKKARKWPLDNELSSSLDCRHSGSLQTRLLTALPGRRRLGKGQDVSPRAQAAGGGDLLSSPGAERAQGPQAGAGPTPISLPETASDGL